MTRGISNCRPRLVVQESCHLPLTFCTVVCARAVVRNGETPKINAHAVAAKMFPRIAVFFEDRADQQVCIENCLESVILTSFVSLGASTLRDSIWS